MRSLLPLFLANDNSGIDIWDSGFVVTNHYPILFDHSYAFVKVVHLPFTDR